MSLIYILFLSSLVSITMEADKTIDKGIHETIPSNLKLYAYSNDGISIVVDTVNTASKGKKHFASSKEDAFLNESEGDDGSAPQICHAGRTIGEYVSNQADYSLELTYDDMYRVIGKSQHLSQSRVQFDGTLSSGYDMTYTYDQDTGRRFQISTIDDVNYRTDSVYTSDDNVIASHYYEYDKNGNIIHALTAETRADGTTVNLTREEKFRWDEENRLLAISQNGYVSQYWYDADGERVVKEHGANQAVFVNSEQNAVFTRTDKFTVYPNPYFSYSDDGRYTKHIYIGAERIASQVGGKPYPSPNTESVSVAGRSNGIDIRVDYTGKLDQHLAQIDSVYDAFDLPYNGTNHDRYYNNYFFDRPGYWDNTEGMTLNGGEPEMPRSIQDRDLLYYYHRDHLGSSTAVSNDDGKLSQQIEYLPYGEVFLEKQMASSDYHSPHRFNGKELDEETGLYYYGARYMNPRLSIWYATDPLQGKYPHVSSYCYAISNPVKYIDSKGLEVIIWYKDNSGKKRTFHFKGFNGKSIKIPNNQYVKDFISAYLYNGKNGGGKNLITAVTNPKYHIYVAEPENSDESYYYDGIKQKTVFWESRLGTKTTEGGFQSPATILEHEMSHAVDDVNNHEEHVRRKGQPDNQYDSKEERRVITGSEAETAKANKESTRKDHKGTYYRTVGPTSTKPEQ